MKVDSDTQKLISKAVMAMKNSHSPHSKFKVGAAILTSNNKIFVGTNIEFDAYSLTVCAERAALFSAVTNGERNIKKIVIVTNTTEFKYPCGLCRQALIEFNPNLEIILLNKNKKKISFILKDYLPEYFKL